MGRTAVLVVDQSTLFLAVARYFLHQRGVDRFAIETASSVADAEAYLATASPELVLVDVKLRCSGGLSAIAHLRRRLPQTGIIALTHLDMNGYRDAALTDGADACVFKGNLHSSLLPTMHAVLRQQGPSGPPGADITSLRDAL